MTTSIITYYYFHIKTVRTYQWRPLWAQLQMSLQLSFPLRSSRCHRPREFSSLLPQGVRDPQSGESAYRCTREGQGAAGRQICSKLAVTVFAQFSMLSYRPLYILRELGSSTTKVFPRQTFVTSEIRLISYWSLITFLHHWYSVTQKPVLLYCSWQLLTVRKWLLFLKIKKKIKVTTAQG
jgi:hypothetical protein